MIEPQVATMIRFKTKLANIGSWTVILLPEAASAQLPSRGQVMVTGTINEESFQTPLEPDGKLSHWFQVDNGLLKAIHADVGDTVNLAIQPTKDWPEPELPADWERALAASKKTQAIWDSATPMAHWEWVRWTRATGKAETRERRIKVGISKLESGERRPCCWNRNLCTEPSVSKSGILLDAEITPKEPKS